MVNIEKRLPRDGDDPLLSDLQLSAGSLQSRRKEEIPKSTKETITVDPNPVMHVARGDRQSIISGGREAN